MRTTTLLGKRQLDRLDASAVHTSGDETGAADKPASTAIRDRLSVELRGDLVPRLCARAVQQRTTTTALVRRAAQALLDDTSNPLGLDKAADMRAKASPSSRAKVDLRMSAEHAALLIGRARAAEMTYGSYVAALLNGAVPLPVPAHHAASVLDLRASTDRLAALSTDLNAFAQMLGKVPSAQLEPFRASLRSLIVDVRSHLSLSAVLIAELHPYRRGRR